MTDWMHPYTDRATFLAFQAAAKRIHLRNSPTDQDYATVALYEALEINAKQLQNLVQQMALLAAQPPVKAISRGP